MSKNIKVECPECHGIGFGLDLDSPIDVYILCHKCKGKGYKTVKITKEEMENAAKERDVKKNDK